MMKTRRETRTESISRCKACASPIDDAAKFCVKCGSHQNRFVNHLKFFTGISGALSLAGALILFSIAKIPEIDKVLFWKDKVKILSFDRERDISVLNTGDGDVWLKHIAIFQAAPGRGTGSLTIPIEKLLKQGETITHTFKVKNKFFRTLIVMQRAGQTKSRLWVEIANRAIDRDDECYSIGYRLKTDGGYQQSKNHYKRQFADVMTLPASAALYFYSVKQNKTLVVPMDLVAIVQRNADIACAEDDGNDSNDVTAATAVPEVRVLPGVFTSPYDTAKASRGHVRNPAVRE
jgi:hypothetical protein